MSEVPLYTSNPTASERRGDTLKRFNSFTAKASPESGPDSLICAEFAQERVGGRVSCKRCRVSRTLSASPLRARLNTCSVLEVF